VPTYVYYIILLSPYWKSVVVADSCALTNAARIIIILYLLSERHRVVYPICVRTLPDVYYTIVWHIICTVERPLDHSVKWPPYMRITLYRRVCYNSYLCIYIYIYHIIYYTLHRPGRTRRAEERRECDFFFSLRFISSPTIITSSSSSRNRSPAFAIHRRLVLNFFIFIFFFFTRFLRRSMHFLHHTPPMEVQNSQQRRRVQYLPILSTTPRTRAFISLSNHKLLYTHAHCIYVYYNYFFYYYRSILIMHLCTNIERWFFCCYFNCMSRQ